MKVFVTALCIICLAGLLFGSGELQYGFGTNIQASVSTSQQPSTVNLSTSSGNITTLTPDNVTVYTLSVTVTGSVKLTTDIIGFNVYLYDQKKYSSSNYKNATTDGIQIVKWNWNTTNNKLLFYTNNSKWWVTTATSSPNSTNMATQYTFQIDFRISPVARMSTNWIAKVDVATMYDGPMNFYSSILTMAGSVGFNLSNTILTFPSIYPTAKNVAANMSDITLDIWSNRNYTISLSASNLTSSGYPDVNINSNILSCNGTYLYNYSTLLFTGSPATSESGQSINLHFTINWSSNFMIGVTYTFMVTIAIIGT